MLEPDIDARRAWAKVVRILESPSIVKECTELVAKKYIEDCIIPEIENDRVRRFRAENAKLYDKYGIETGRIVQWNLL